MPDFNPALTRRAALAGLAVSSMAAKAAADAPAGTSRGEEALISAVEVLRVAMVEGDGKTLELMLHDHLNYMHSSGNSQTKANVLSDLAGKTFFASLVHSEVKVDIIGENGIVKMTVDQVKNLPGGKTRASQIKVLQVWAQVNGQWKLIARASALIPAQPGQCKI